MRWRPTADISTLRHTLFVIGCVLCFFPWVSAAIALVMGIAFSLSLGNPWPSGTSKFSKIILQVSVVGLGFGLMLGEVLQTGRDSIVFTIVGIGVTLIVGYLLGKMFRTEKNTSALISFGTAICGGSAIAAMAPVIRAKDDETAIALATVFTLNSVALLLFPIFGHLLDLSQTTFGTWAGLAIHDTSSVVGAAAAYGSQALAVGTTVKLTRALWITPIVIGAAWIKKSDGKIKVPLFIIGFVLAAAIATMWPQYGDVWQQMTAIAKRLLVLTLFLIGTGLSREVLRKVGVRPFLQGITLWLLVGSLTLAALMLIGIE